MTKMRDLLEPEFIHFDLQATTKNAAIRELTNAFVTKGVVKNDSVYLAAVMKRGKKVRQGSVLA